MRKTIFPLLSVALMLFTVGCGDRSVNRSISVADGQTVSNDLSTVNGSIRIGNQASVQGAAQTVNGSIRVGDGSTVTSVKSVNGSITLSAAVTASGDVETTNGSIEMAAENRVEGHVRTTNGRIRIGQGGHVAGPVSSVNGRIELNNASVESVANYSGGMLVDNGSEVRGELRVRRGRVIRDQEPPEIIIGANSQVAGPLVFERPVRLRVHESAEIGEVEGAEIERFED